jgi:hypothetical protein
VRFQNIDLLFYHVDGFRSVEKWKCPASTTGGASTFIGFRRNKLAEAAHKYPLPDFSNWKNHNAFERSFASLEKDLRTSIGK